MAINTTATVCVVAVITAVAAIAATAVAAPPAAPAFHESFEEGADGWEGGANMLVDAVAHGGGHSVRLTVADPMRDSVYVTRKIPVDGGAYYAASCFVKIKNVVEAPGTKSSCGAGLIVEWADRDGAWLKSGQYACGLRGTADWRRVECASLKAPEDAGYAIVFLALRDSGTAWFDDITLERVNVGIEKRTPENGAIFANNCPRFEWLPSSGVRAYTVELSRDPSFATGSVRSFAAGGLPRLQLRKPLEPGVWHWRVVATGLPDTRPWSFTQTAPSNRDCLPPLVGVKARRVTASDEPFSVSVEGEDLAGVRLQLKGAEIPGGAGILPGGAGILPAEVPGSAGILPAEVPGGAGILPAEVPGCAGILPAEVPGSAGILPAEVPGSAGILPAKQPQVGSLRSQASAVHICSFAPPPGGWPAGLTEGRLIATDATGNASTNIFWLLNAPAPTNAVVIGVDGFYLENGQRIFPLGIYEVEPADMPDVRAAGFDVVHNYLWERTQDDAACRRYLDACGANGLRAFIGFDRGVRTGKGILQGNFGCVARRVGAIADHPALFCWYLYDEPEWLNQFITPELLEEFADLVRALDPYHAVVMTTWDATMKQYRRTWDTHWTQAYGNPAEVLERVEEHRRFLDGESPITLLVNCNDERQSKRRQRGIEPNPTTFARDRDHLRACAFLGIAKECNGVVWWWFGRNSREFYSASQCPKAWNDLKAVVGELRARRGIVAADGTVESGTARDGKARVEWWQKRTDGKTCFIAVNTADRPVSVTVESSSGKRQLDLGRYEVMVEER